MTEAPITMAEAHSAGFCATGQRKFLSASVPGWRQYIKTGMPFEVALEAHPALAQRVLELREARRGEEA